MKWYNNILIKDRFYLVNLEQPLNKRKGRTDKILAEIKYKH